MTCRRIYPATTLLVIVVVSSVAGVGAAVLMGSPTLAAKIAIAAGVAALFILALFRNPTGA